MAVLAAFIFSLDVDEERVDAGRDSRRTYLSRDQIIAGANGDL